MGIRCALEWLRAICGWLMVVLVGAAALPIKADIVPTTDDVWDVHQGIRILESSDVRPGFDLRDVFGGNQSTAEKGAAVFDDPKQVGAVHFVEWETPTVVTVKAVALFAVGDGVSYANQREVRRFRLMTKSAGSEDFDTVFLDFEPVHPYAFVDPVRVALLATNLPMVTGQVFRAEFTGWDGGNGEKGPRIVELDAYSTMLPAVGIFPPGGVLTNLTEVRIGVTDPNLTVRYTLDGSEPNETSAVYGQPFLVVRSLVIKARAFTARHAVSELAQAEFRAPEVCVLPDTGLVRWWTGNGNRNEEISEGAVEGAASDRYEAGVVGQAFSFDLDAPGFVLRDTPDVHLQNFTLEGWVRRTRISDAVSSGVILTFPKGGYGVGFLPDNRLYLSQVEWSHVSSDFMVHDTNWHHLAVTRLNGKVVFYLDGRPDPAKVYAPEFYFSGAPSMGMTASGGSQFLGAVDELSLYHRALGETAIRAIALAGANGKCRMPAARIEPSSRDFSEPLKITVSLSPGTADGVIRYTLDGVDPASDSPLYTGAFEISSTRTVKARFFHYSGLPTAVASATFRRRLPPDCTAPEGLVRWFPAEGDASDRVVGAEGTATDGVRQVGGIRGTAFEFDGLASAVTSPVSDGLSLFDFTIEAWLRRSDLAQVTLGASGQAALVSLGEEYDFAMLGDGRLALARNDSRVETRQLAIQDGEWHHVAVAQQGLAAVFFIDGKFEVSGDITSYFPFTPEIITTGGAHRRYGTFLGALDEIGIYNRALAAEEVGVLSQNGPSGKCGLPGIQISPAGGQFQVATTVVMEGRATNGVIRYTLDGTSPTKDSQDYRAPIVLTETTTLRARQFSGDIAASLEGVATFEELMPDRCVKSEGLISWWRGEGVLGDAVGGLSPSYSMDVGYVPGRVGTALAFNGLDSKVALSGGRDLPVTNFTLEAWIQRQDKAVATLGGTGNGVIFAYGNGGLGFGIFHDGRLFLTQVGVGFVASPPAVVDLEWHHVGVTKTGSNIRFYVDGVRQSESEYDATFSFQTEPMIGASPVAGGTGFYGLIDELSLYRRGLGESEMREIYDAGAFGNCPDYPPLILTQPVGARLVVGGAASFGLRAVGTPLLSYQWYRDGQRLDGAKSPQLSITGASIADLGSYFAVVSNQFGVAVSSNATLTLGFGPEILRPPQAQKVFAGGSVAFQVTASGDAPLSYQWFRDGAPIANASTPRLMLAETRPSDAGNYSVRISNFFGEVTSELVALTVVSGRMSAIRGTDGIHITVVGELGATYSVQRSADLTNWESVATVLNTGATWEFEDRIEPETEQLFYRLLLR
ncbi:MAG: chitobiase/beta-hexosaminidase C-terminal domain-containing protein [Verrucomicrobiales bacterium]|nr:chitobiase/beta-hexosaminidase C-terminal domain-containing protein [Verrucomicrobiales bacterium]